MSRTKKNKKLHKKTNKPKRSKKPYILALLFVIIGSILIIAYVNTKTITVHEHPVRLTNLPAENHGFKIIHFSDLHYGSSFSGNDLERLIKAIERAKPDLIVFTGDLIEDTVSRTEERLLVEHLNKLDPSIGTYAVFGDIDKERAIDIFEQTNITVLENSLEAIYSNSHDPIYLFGLTYSNPNFDELIENKELVQNHVVILLTHHPDHFNQLSEVPVNLVLAGHSHNGQINLPLIDLWNRIDRDIVYSRAFTRVDETMIYTSAGIGTKYIPIRFGAPSSLNLYRLLASE